MLHKITQPHSIVVKLGDYGAVVGHFLLRRSFLPSIHKASCRLLLFSYVAMMCVRIPNSRGGQKSGREVATVYLQSCAKASHEVHTVLT